jgi:hypothetical protein
MDAPGLDPATYARILNDLRRVNGWTLAKRPTLNFLSRAIGNLGHFRLLDVASGKATCCARSRAGQNEGAVRRPCRS